MNYAKRRRLRISFAAMKHKDMLVASSLFSNVLLTLHLAQDALQARPGTNPAGAGNLTGIAILIFLFCGPVLLAERRVGRMIMMFGGVAAMGMPALHFALGADLTKHREALLFVWCLILLGVIGALTVILSVMVIRSASAARAPG